MKILAALVSSFLINLVVAVIVSFVLTSTLFNPTYLAKKADQANIYSTAQSMLLDAFVNDVTDVKEKERIREAINKVITPDYLKKKVEGLASQLDKRIHGKSDTLELDVSDLGERITAAGFNIDTSRLPKTIPLPPEYDAQITQASVLTHTIQLWASVGSILILGIMILLSIRARQYRSLIYFFLMTSVSLFSLSLAFLYGPQVAFSQIIRFDESSKVAIDLLSPMAVAIGADVGMRFLYLGIAFAIATVAVFIVSRISKAKTIKTKNKTPAT